MAVNYVCLNECPLQTLHMLFLCAQSYTRRNHRAACLYHLTPEQLSVLCVCVSLTGPEGPSHSLSSTITLLSGLAFYMLEMDG